MNSEEDEFKRIEAEAKRRAARDEDDDIQVYKKPWIGLTDVEIHRTTVLMGFNPEWKTEIGMAHAIVRSLEAKLKEKNT